MYLFRVGKKAGKITLDPSHPAHSLFELLPTQEQFLPTGNPSHEHLTLKVEHTTLLHYLFTTHQMFTYHNCTYIIVYIIYCVFAILYIAYLYIIILLSVSCPVAAFLLHCGASVTITNSLYV